MHKQIGRRSARAMSVLCVGLLIGLSGCGSMRDALGISKNPPDEFAILTKAPLVMPPDYALRPPRPGQAELRSVQPSDSAQTAILPAGAQAGAMTTGQQLLLQKAGALNADPEIRKTLNTDAGNRVEKDQGFVDRIVFWRGAPDITAEAELNPDQEEARLVRQRRLEQAIGEGEEVVIKKSGSLKLPGVK